MFNYSKQSFIFYIFICGLILFFSPAPILTAATAVETKRESSSATKAPRPTESRLSWEPYTYNESGFAIDLPKQPEHMKQSIDVPKTDLKIKYETYLSEPSDNVVFVVSIWDYPDQVDMSNAEVSLQDGFSGMLAALPDSKVLKMKINDVQGFKSLEFLVKNENIFFQGKLLLVYNTLYQVFSVYKDSEEMTKNYAHFIDSFHLIDPEKHKSDYTPTLPKTGKGSAPPPKSKGYKVNV